MKAQEGSTIQWGARQAFESVERTPVAVVDRGDIGKEAMTKVVAEDGEELLRKVLLSLY